MGTCVHCSTPGDLECPCCLVVWHRSCCSEIAASTANRTVDSSCRLEFPSCFVLIFFVTCACNILLRINFCNASHCTCRERAMHRIACGCPNKLASTSRLEYGMSHQNLVRAHRPSSKLTYLRVQASLPRKQIEFRVRHATPQVCASTCASIATTQGGGQQL